MTTLTISLPDSLDTFIEAQRAAKGFASASDYVQSLLQTAKAKEEVAALESLLLEGLASEPIALDQDFWDQLEVETEMLPTSNIPERVP